VSSYPKIKHFLPINQVSSHESFLSQLAFRNFACQRTSVRKLAGSSTSCGPPCPSESRRHAACGRKLQGSSTSSGPPLPSESRSHAACGRKLQGSSTSSGPPLPSAVVDINTREVFENDCKVHSRDVFPHHFCKTSAFPHINLGFLFLFIFLVILPSKALSLSLQLSHVNHRSVSMTFLLIAALKVLSKLKVIRCLF
jgi:hypothetical protein